MSQQGIPPTATSTVSPTSTPTPMPPATQAQVHAAEIHNLLDGLDADDFFDDDLDDDQAALSPVTTPAPLIGSSNIPGPPPRVGGVGAGLLHGRSGLAAGLAPAAPLGRLSQTAPAAGTSQRTPPRRSGSRSATPEPYPGAYATPSPPPAEIPTVVRFATARGGKIAEPSSEALKRAMKIMREAEGDLERDFFDPDDRVKRPRIDTPPATISTAAVPPAPSFSTPSLRPAPLPAFPASQPTHISTPAPTLMARSLSNDTPQAYATPAPVNARARVMALFADADEPASPSVMRVAINLPTSAGSSSRVTTLLTAASATERQASPERAQLAGSSQPRANSGFQTAAGGAAPALSAGAAARAQALALFGDEPSHPSAPGSQEGRAAALRPSSPAPAATPAAPFRPLLPSSTPRRAASPATMLPPSTPSRPPLHPKPENAAAGPSTPLGSVKLPRRIEIRTPGPTPRRIGLGLGATPAGKRPKKGFTTPFKAPGSATPSSAKVATPLGLRTTVPAPRQSPPKAERIWEPVFDLERAKRVSMRALQFRPGFYTAADLEHLGIPDEICEINLGNAILYQFIAEDSSVLGNRQALVHLKRQGCELVTAKWVDNHWPLILWKIAGQIKAKPTVAMFNDKWNWYEVICQLKYRYEREFGAAQRPLVRRIQEHDSPSSLPMVLCVSRIHRPPPAVNDKDEPVPQRPYLDLTDGWYHIRATVDECLVRAIQKGRIKVGLKLAITGAKLDSGADGCDVLEAYEKSNLVLSGNSTHLTLWDAKLGAQPQPFVAGLTSLSMDGGHIALMDMVIDKIFPLAFIHAGKQQARDPPWNEEEEQTRRDAWKDKYEAESTRLQEEMRKNLEKIEDLAGTLVSYAQDVSVPVSHDPPDTIDSEFDNLLEMDTAPMMTRLRALPTPTIVHLARHAARRVEQAVMEERDGIELKLRDVCPKREIRNFRVVRFVDARQTTKAYKRIGMLNVWEASGLGDALVEGRRYLVSNLVPGRTGDWSKPSVTVIKEVYLHTRKDTRWKPVAGSRGAVKSEG